VPPNTIKVGNGPSGVAVTPAVSSAGDWIGYAYVLNSIGGTVAVIGPDTYGFVTLIGTITVGNRPGSAAVTPDGLHVYVTNYEDNTVSVIDTTTNTVTTTIDVGKAPGCGGNHPGRPLRLRHQHQRQHGVGDRHHHQRGDRFPDRRRGVPGWAGVHPRRQLRLVNRSGKPGRILRFCLRFCCGTKL